MSTTWMLMFPHAASPTMPENLQARLNAAERDSAERRWENDALSDKVARLELTVDALVEVLWSRGVATRDELAIAMQRIDLVDGVEDGRIGPDRSAQAPKCSHCGRPVNIKRSHCLFCTGKIDIDTAPSRSSTASRETRCCECGTIVREDQVRFGARGLYCGQCVPK
jgi:hypothetical protein